MINISFYKPSEVSVSHHDTLICLLSTSSFEQQGFEPRELIVEYHWVEYQTKDDDYTGTCITYEPETDSKYKLGDRVDFSEGRYCILEWLAGEYNSEDISYCVPVDEYWKIFEEVK